MTITLRSGLDPFTPEHTDTDIHNFLATVAANPATPHYLCTEYADRMRVLLTDTNARFHVWEAMRGHDSGALSPAWPLDNLHLGVIVSTQQEADIRIPQLMACGFDHRFIITYMLTTPIDLSKWLRGRRMPSGKRRLMNSFSTVYVHRLTASPENTHDWLRSLRDQCLRAGVEFTTDWPLLWG